MLALAAREEKAPIWAGLVPVLYLAGCAMAVGKVTQESGSDVGIAGLLLAVGLIPAFVVPVIFASRKVMLGITIRGFSIDGKVIAISDARLAADQRGTGRLRVQLPNGGKRTFVLESYRAAQDFVAMMPASSAPSLSLRASFSDA
jgi:hypothetical protein